VNESARDRRALHLPAAELVRQMTCAIAEANQLDHLRARGWIVSSGSPCKSSGRQTFSSTDIVGSR
jgi:hypothetical protein